jgi:hypothetical protein
MMETGKEAIAIGGWVRSGKDWKCALDGFTVVSRELVPNVAPKTNSHFENPSCRSPEKEFLFILPEGNLRIFALFNTLYVSSHALSSSVAI